MNPHDAYWSITTPLCAACWAELQDDTETLCPDCQRESDEQYFRAVMPFEEFQHEEDWRAAA